MSWASVAALAIQQGADIEVALLASVVWLPVLEEVLFRDALWMLLIRARLSILRVNVVSAAAFALAHVPALAGVLPAAWQAWTAWLGGLWAMGLVFGWLRHRYGLVAAISGHGLANAMWWALPAGTLPMAWLPG